MTIAEETYSLIREEKVVAVIRGGDPSEAVELGKAVRRGGIRLVEIAMTTPSALDAIEKLREMEESGGAVVGVGTVLTPRRARDAIDAGARFLVSPHLTDDVGEVCRRAGVPYIPGATTPSEVVACLDSGAEIVKIFPAGQLGPGWIKALKGPFPHANLMPTGGVTIRNCAAFLEAGSCALGAGGALTGRARKAKDPSLAQEAASAMMATVAEYLRGTGSKEMQR
jgi:2-dehydro-3-deoxyphosphogluconate aldolase/(4S)-4-hydroxy-2-oxoglutarate aldolase